jgi:endogenous inhibitor of DNA gyrase (YacG/DUF329 family)
MHCPTCKSEFDPALTAAMPFCSERCRSIDLGRWLDERNSLPHVPDPEDDETPDEPWASEGPSPPAENGNK